MFWLAGTWQSASKLTQNLPMPAAHPSRQHSFVYCCADIRNREVQSAKCCSPSQRPQEEGSCKNRDAIKNLTRLAVHRSDLEF